MIDKKPYKIYEDTLSTNKTKKSFVGLLFRYATVYRTSFFLSLFILPTPILYDYMIFYAVL